MSRFTCLFIMHVFVCCSQVLELLWNLAHRDDCPTDTMDHALTAHLKILDYSCSQVTMHSMSCLSTSIFVVGLLIVCTLDEDFQG